MIISWPTMIQQRKMHRNNITNAFNVEFPWVETSLSQIESSIGPAPFITANMVLSSIQKIQL